MQGLLLKGLRLGRNMADDLGALERMLYSGRGIIVGMTNSGSPFVGYSLTGRSPSSQARKLVHDKKTHTIFTDVTDAAQLKKGSPALLLYPAVAFVPGRGIVASNGAQTKLLYSAARSLADDFPALTIGRAFGHPFFEYDPKENRWIDITTFEPDEPNFTPRISACMYLPEGVCAMHHVSRVRGTTDGKAERVTAWYLKRGKAHLLTTYKGGNESPLEPSDGEPIEMAFGSWLASDIAENIYEAIKGKTFETNYRVAVAVMLLERDRIPSDDAVKVAVINRSERGN